MVNIRKGLLQFVFSGSYMKRWNDKLRPMEFIEADKQAHKMIVAWLLCRLNSEDNTENRLALEQEVIERAMFDYFFRLVITDIKPPVYYRIKANPSDYTKLSTWVLTELEPWLRPLDSSANGFWKRLEDFIKNPDNAAEKASGKSSLASQILDAAHNYASSWEFGILKGMNSFDPEVPEIEKSFQKNLEAHINLKGLDKLLEPSSDTPATSALGGFAKLCGQLRFQKRWSQTPRIPETSVMGHMFMVACYSYFFSMAVGACPARMVNNFFCALFHDLPELLTRDIISPVKKSVDTLGDLIRDYENEELERRVFNPLRKEGYTQLVDRLGYYLGLDEAVGSEFQECVMAHGKLKSVNFDELQSQYNDNSFDPKDGKLIKICDNLAAFMEAYNAMRNGISSDHLHQAIWRIRSENAKLSIGDVHVGALLADFD
jgi:putative hydrolase of HD superfamily